MFKEEDLEAEALLVQGEQQEPVILNRLQAQLVRQIYMKCFEDYFIFHPLQINQINLNIIRAFYYNKLYTD